MKGFEDGRPVAVDENGIPYRPQNLEEMQQVLLDPANHDPGPYFTSNCMRDLLERVFKLERAIRSLTYLDES